MRYLRIASYFEVKLWLMEELALFTLKSFSDVFYSFPIPSYSLSDERHISTHSERSYGEADNVIVLLRSRRGSELGC